MAKKKKDIIKKGNNFRCYNVKSKKKEGGWKSVDTVKMNPQIIEMREQIKKRIIGQAKAVDKLTEIMIKMQVKLVDMERKSPQGVFIFLGPTGVGKTELVKALAEPLIGRFGAITRIDCSELSDDLTVSRLIGASPNYIGYDATPLLCQLVIDAPYLEIKFPEFKKLNGQYNELKADYIARERWLSQQEKEARGKKIMELLNQIAEFRKQIKSTEVPSIVLLDEIEKAAPKVIKIFLQVFAEGELVTNMGRTSFKNTIFVMTSNVGADGTANILSGKGTPGFVAKQLSQEEIAAKIEKNATGELENIFPRELIGRIMGLGGVVTFHSLSEEEKGQIVTLQLDDFITKALTSKYSGEDRIIVQYLEKEIVPHILRKVNPQYGARDITRVLTEEIFNPFRTAVSSGEIQARYIVHVSIQEGRVKLYWKKRPKPKQLKETEMAKENVSDSPLAAGLPKGEDLLRKQIIDILDKYYGSSGKDGSEK